MTSYTEIYSKYKPLAEQNDPHAQLVLSKYYHRIDFDYTSGDYWLQKSVAQGYTPAMVQLGDNFREGCNSLGKVSMPSANYWYERAAELNDPEGMFKIGIMNRDGLGRPLDYKSAMEWLVKAAEHGCYYGYLAAGNMYHLGKGFPLDVKEATKYFKKCLEGMIPRAEEGDECSEMYYGYCLYRGIGIDQDVAAGVKYLRRAAVKGSAFARFYLGKCYDDGTGVKKDPKTGFQLKRLAAKQGRAGAQIEIAEMYHTGKFVEKDTEQAMVWIYKAIEREHCRAINYLGLCYYLGDGVPQDYSEMMNLFLLAASKNDWEAPEYLSLCYRDGIGAEQSDEEAFRWAKVAADLGNVDMQFEVAKLYQMGKGTSKNAEQAFQYFRKAADGGDKEAMFECGDCLRNGRGTEKCFEEAVQMYARMDNYRGDYAIAMCYLTADDSYRNYEKAAHFLQEASAKGSSIASSRLGAMYLMGCGVKKDYDRALSLFNASTFQDFSKYCLGNMYYYGYGVPQDCKKASNYYLNALVINQAKIKLAIRFLRGSGVKKNHQKAIEFFKSSVGTDGSLTGFWEFTDAVTNDQTTLEIDQHSTSKFGVLLSHAENGSITSNIRLAEYFYNGRTHGAPNLESSSRFFRNAATFAMQINQKHFTQWN